MDVDTSEAIETLRGDIQQVEATLHSELTSLRSDMKEMRTELRTHTQVLVEAVHDDVRLVAEAVAVLTVKVDAIRDAREPPDSSR